MLSVEKAELLLTKNPNNNFVNADAGHQCSGRLPLIAFCATSVGRRNIKFICPNLTTALNPAAKAIDCLIFQGFISLGCLQFDDMQRLAGKSRFGNTPQDTKVASA